MFKDIFSNFLQISGGVKCATGSRCTHRGVEPGDGAHTHVPTCWRTHVHVQPGELTRICARVLAHTRAHNEKL